MKLLNLLLSFKTVYAVNFTLFHSTNIMSQHHGIASAIMGMVITFNIRF
jgi:hypothetical protein